MGRWKDIATIREENKRLEKYRMELENTIYGVKDAVMEGDFVTVVAKETIFKKYIATMFPYDSCEEIKSLRRGSFLLLSELFGAIKKKDANAMRRAYSEFIRLYVLMDGDEKGAKDEWVQKTQEIKKTSVENNEKKNEYVQHLTEERGQGALSLTPDFFNELEFNKIDEEVAKYATTKEINKVTPDKNGVKNKPKKKESNECAVEKGNDKKDGLKNQLNIDMNGWDSISVSNRLRNEITLEKNGNREKRRDQEGNDKTVSLKKRLNIDMNGWNEHSNHKLRTNKRKHI